MRDIKFRAWNKKLKRFAPENCSIQIQGDDSHVSFDTFDGNFDTEVWGIEDCELMQYTGLKDNNGVEIYEGDIVSLWYAPRATAKGRIKFENGAFYFKTTEAEPNICLAHDCVYESGNEFTAIGNIYENPELLGAAV